MTVCTFDGTTVPTSRIASVKMIGSGGSIQYEATLDCTTETYSDYTTLAAKYAPCGTDELIGGKIAVTSSGTCGTLVLDGNTYTNCYIKDLTAAEVQNSNLGVWSFSITFVRDTSL